MSEVLSQLAERYELVVIDTAPIGVVSDAFPLLRKVDGVIVVARMGQSTRDSAERLREQLSRLEAPVLGIVANAIKTRRGGRYGYGVLRRLPAGGGAGERAARWARAPARRFRGRAAARATQIAPRRRSTAGTVRIRSFRSSQSDQLVT